MADEYEVITENPVDPTIFTKKLGEIFYNGSKFKMSQGWRGSGENQRPFLMIGAGNISLYNGAGRIVMEINPKGRSYTTPTTQFRVEALSSRDISKAVEVAAEEFGGGWKKV